VYTQFQIEDLRVKLKRGIMQAAEFVDLHWINSPPVTLADLKGRVVLVYFWDYTSINCLRALSYVKVWYGRYMDKGLSIIGIHAPEFPFGKDPENVSYAVEELGIEFPVANDPEFATWKEYANRYWPAFYLVDSEGFLSDFQFGEGGYDEIEGGMQSLLRERETKLVLPRVMDALRPEDTGEVRVRPVSPEVYLGYSRGRIGNREGFVPGSNVVYSPTEEEDKDVFYAEGTFGNEAYCVRNEGDDVGRIMLSYDAIDVYLVAEPGLEAGRQGFSVEQDGGPLPLELFGDAAHGGPQGPHVDVDRPGLYHIVHNNDYSRHRLVLSTSSKGLKFFCVSFVSA